MVGHTARLSSTKLSDLNLSVRFDLIFYRLVVAAILVNVDNLL